MQKIGRFIIVFAAFFAAACVPETENFLSDPGAKPADKRVIGTWYMLQRDGSEAVVLTIRAVKGQKHLNVIWTEMKPRRAGSLDDPPVQFVHFAAHTTKIGGARYLNLRLVDRSAWKSATPRRFIMRYWVGKRGMRLAFMKRDVVKKAVKAGRLAGKLVKDDVMITADRKALIAFIRRTGPDKVFNKPSKPLRRLHATAS